MSGIITIRLKHYDINGHNFGIEENAPERSTVTRITVCLPGCSSPFTIKAIASYKSKRRATIRSTKIDKWLRDNSLVDQEFTATLTIFEDGEEHRYSDFKPIWLI